MICNGCVYAQRTRDLEENLQHKCPFCRQHNLDTPAEVELVAMKRVKANDPVALRQMGACRYREGDYDTAFEYWTKAVELGDVDAHFKLSTMYEDGIGVEKDEKKELHYLTEAAISGHPGARYNLANYEGRRGRYERAAKHLIIAANLGHDGALQKLKEGYANGHVSKEDFAAALRAHQAAVDAAKSPQREEAEAFLRNQM
jgi:TPR repeat protein